MARTIGSPGWLLGAWVLTGVLTVVGALSYGELAAMMPRAGGQYVYLREAFSPLWGFLYGWTLFLVIQTGTIAAVAVGFARYFGALVPVDRRRPLSRSRRSTCRSRLRAVAVDDAAGRHPADRAAHVDQHARARIRPDHPERLHDRQDRRARRADPRRRAARLEPRRRWPTTSATSGRRAGRVEIVPGLSAVTAFGLFVADLRLADRFALLGRRVEQHHVHRRRGEGPAPEYSAVAGARDLRRHRPVSARQRRLPRHAAVRSDPARARRPRRDGDARTRSFRASARRSWRSASWFRRSAATTG